MLTSTLRRCTSSPLLRRALLHSSRPLLRSSAAESPSDAAVMTSLLDGSLSHHRLEQELGNAERAVRVRRTYFEATSAASDMPIGFGGLPLDGIESNDFYESVVGTNCENVIGYVPIPVGMVGPLVLDGQTLHVPLATTEGALVASTNRGARAISAAGGAVSALLNDGMTRAPLLACVDLPQAAALKAFCEDPVKLAELQQVFSTTSRFGKLIDIKVAIAGRHAFPRFRCSTGDAMGMNMVGKGVNTVVEHLVSHFPGCELLALSGNYCTDKKPSAVNWIDGRGKSVAVEAVIPAAIVRSVLKAEPTRVAEVNLHKNLVGSALAGSLGGFNAHASNNVTAVYLACGQDPAQNVESSTCITTVETVPTADGDHDLRIACTMPSVECGTVGGGTSLPGQKACLQMLGIQGSGEVPGANAQRLACIVAATVLCGELSLLSALSSNHLISAHLALNRRPK
uniref:3-hydroxy-3-methylglutaryl coenzyme A reductase n=1 Tax=Haptolina brevifila TaxID=156173 RepID=A0A7S2I0H4_9EUKA|mmetsp:Transcript_59490/g.118206  ORF Transcript_59490/g.118206 Transcript_59490/m.118206 type:complete len:456 (+) Transcript_59490:39-1406(+)|eukprot:CAMPEP_0174717566 /NCGR_PEP_ID=MMETSP1094-20130205/26555_1 /TAXON_ID=156173 /ORGANISM="Chrysochromulina brevifilum, Strain UTEX LB 985" /LENGTH=455 /DNA_ID=CAMNT_0015917515 /DNA_START=36 /DNA_END=1403 /DNA_ORIENTATION=+